MLTPLVGLSPLYLRTTSEFLRVHVSELLTGQMRRGWTGDSCLYQGGVEELPQPKCIAVTNEVIARQITQVPITVEEKTTTTSTTFGDTWVSNWMKWYLVQCLLPTFIPTSIIPPEHKVEWRYELGCEAACNRINQSIATNCRMFRPCWPSSTVSYKTLCMQLTSAYVA